MLPIARSLSFLLLLGFTTLAAAELPPLQPISLRGFQDSTSHWRKIRDESRFIKAEPDQPSYAPEQVREIVANILLFQRANGGWPKDYEMAAILTGEQRAQVQATHERDDASFDNGNLHSQVSYLAHACAQELNPAWRAACERGFDFLLGCQYENGGFPQRWPHPKGFHAHITFNDYVMIGILNVLRDAADDEPHFRWLDADRRAHARDAVRRGAECILKCQIQTAQGPTGWCQQHDEVTYEPRPGRSFELASCCPQDTTNVVEFLMRDPTPSTELRRAIDSAVAWLDRVQLKGVRVEKVPAPKEEFQRYSSDFDKVVVSDPAAPALWARHYEIGTDRPVFAGRDGQKHYAFAQMERERRTGTPWYGEWPKTLLKTGYAAWRAKVSGS
jgi:PelA/Pel-15E family pectate lyase